MGDSFVVVGEGVLMLFDDVDVFGGVLCFGGGAVVEDLLCSACPFVADGLSSSFISDANLQANR